MVCDIIYDQKLVTILTLGDVDDGAAADDV